MLLTLSLFGSFEAICSGKRMTFATTTTRALLVYLAVESHRSHSREALAAFLWPDQPQSAAYTNLRQTLSHLRRAFPDSSDVAAVLTITPQTIQCNGTAVSLDVVRFKELLAACQAHQHEAPGHCSECMSRLQEVAALYRGEFLTGLFLKNSQPFEEWLLVKREEFHRQALETLYTLAQYHEAIADYEQMYRYASRQLELEPWREEAHAQAMLALTLAGKRSAALAHYQNCCRILESELGIGPSSEIVTLYERIRTGQFAHATGPAPAPRHNLPTPLTPFVGRERELSALTASLQQPDVRLLTLVGAGGMGKTRLALELARTQPDLFRDGVFFVSLAP